jgi:hypothetical protein
MIFVGRRRSRGVVTEIIALGCDLPCVDIEWEARLSVRAM